MDNTSSTLIVRQLARCFWKFIDQRRHKFNWFHIQFRQCLFGNNHSESIPKLCILAIIFTYCSLWYKHICKHAIQSVIMQYAYWFWLTRHQAWISVTEHCMWKQYVYIQWFGAWLMVKGYMVIYSMTNKLHTVFYQLVIDTNIQQIEGHVHIFSNVLYLICKYENLWCMHLWLSEANILFIDQFIYSFIFWWWWWEGVHRNDLFCIV